MKLKLFVAALGLCFTAASANAQDYLDKISVSACECLDKLDYSQDKENLNMQMGVCILEAANPYRAELKKNNNIDLEKINGKDGRKLGELIGQKMIGTCPQAMIDVTQGKSSKSHSSTEIISNKAVTGNIKDLTGEQFPVLTLTESDGKSTSFLWLNFFEGSGDLMKDKTQLLNKSVSVEFVEQELYDSKLKEYRKFKVIKKFSLL